MSLDKARTKLAASSLAGPHDYLLKLVQLANLLQATTVEFRLQSHLTKVRFETSTVNGLDTPTNLAKALINPLSQGAQHYAALALLAAQTQAQQQTVWRSLGPQQSYQVERLPDQRAIFRELPGHGQAGIWTLELTVRRKRRGWLFWRGADQIASATSLLRRRCRFSPARLVVNGQEVKAPQTSLLNDHLLTTSPHLRSSRKRAPLAAAVASFELTENAASAAALLRPSLSSYLVRQQHFNLWVSGTRPLNDLEPDGESSPAWALRFVRQRQPVSMRLARKRDLYRSVVCLHLWGSGALAKPRVRAVHHGVLLSESDVVTADRDLDRFRGCSVLIAGSELETDLSGLQLRQGGELAQALRCQGRQVEAAKTYFTQAAPLLPGLPQQG